MFGGRRRLHHSRSPNFSTLPLGVRFPASTSPISPITERWPRGRSGLHSTAPRSAMPFALTPLTNSAPPSITPASGPMSDAYCSPRTGRRRKTVAGHFAPEATKGFAATMATATRRRLPPRQRSAACTSWKHSASFASCRRSSSAWCPVGPPAAVTACTSWRTSPCERGTRTVQADRCRRRELRRRVRLCLPGTADGTEIRSGDLLFGTHVHR